MNINPNIHIVRLPYNSSIDLTQHDCSFEYTVRCLHTHRYDGVYNISRRREGQAARRYNRSIRGLRY